MIPTSQGLSVAPAQAATPTPTPTPTLKPTPKPRPKPTPKPITHYKKTMRLDLVDDPSRGTLWYALEVGAWVTLWCPKGYKAISGSYHFTKPDHQKVVGSRKTSKSGRQGWQFRVDVSYEDSFGVRRGSLYAVCLS